MGENKFLGGVGKEKKKFFWISFFFWKKGLFSNKPLKKKGGGFFGPQKVFFFGFNSQKKSPQPFCPLTRLQTSPDAKKSLNQPRKGLLFTGQDGF